MSGRMSIQTRAKPTSLTICDLCDKEINPQADDDYGDLFAGYGRGPVTEKTGHARMWWPTSKWSRRRDWKETQRPENRGRRYDFHGECIVRLVQKHAVTNQETGAA